MPAIFLLVNFWWLCFLYSFLKCVNERKKGREREGGGIGEEKGEGQRGKDEDLKFSFPSEVAQSCSTL